MHRLRAEPRRGQTREGRSFAPPQGPQYHDTAALLAVHHMTYCAGRADGFVVKSFLKTSCENNDLTSR